MMAPGDLRKALETEREKLPPAEAAKNGHAPKAKKKEEPAGAKIELETAEPWGEPVSGSAVALEVIGAIQRHVSISDHAAVATALWTMFAWVHDSSRISPLLTVTAPTKRCGKSTLLTLVSM